MVYDIGDVSRLSVTFTNLAGDLADPTAVALIIQSPDGIQTVINPVSIINPSTGVYHYDLSLTQSGLYLYRYTGTGSITAVEEGQIEVRGTILIPQPPANPPLWVYADLITITKAMASGVRKVHFQDRTVEYDTLEEKMLAKGLIEAYLGIGAATSMRRQVRMVTSKGF